MISETIAAIATAPGRGGVAIVRVSGPDAFAVAERITGKTPRPGRIQYTAFSNPQPPTPNPQLPTPNAQRPTPNSQPPTPNPQLPTPNPQLPTPNPQPPTPNRQPLLDTGLLLSFKAPHSYTGEDVVEFQCHGGTVTPRRILEACFSAGARLARRGEFTERAFLNGRLDYDQAESVLDLIDAKTDRAADAAVEGLSGRKTRELKALYDAVLTLSSTLEHALDVDEGDLPDGFLVEREAELTALRATFSKTLTKMKEGKMLRDGSLVVLAGAPNAGKSSLLNALLGENRAIVSPTAGTTRDSIEEWLDLDGWPVRLVDTAGLRETADAIEAEGVRRAEDLMAKADVVVRLVAADDDAVGRGPLAVGGGPLGVGRWSAKEIVVLSKCDLLNHPTPNSQLPTPNRQPPTPNSQPPPPNRLSVKTGEGLPELKRAIVARLEARSRTASDAGASADRLIAALLEAQSLLPSAMDDLVLAGNALARTADVLGSPLGAVYSEDLLDALFSRFCVGK